MSEIIIPGTKPPAPPRPAPRDPRDEPFQIDGESGLAVPTALATRKREVILPEEWKALNRAIEKVIGPRQLQFLIMCRADGCPGRLIRKVPLDDGGFSLQCGCRDRVYNPPTPSRRRF